MLHYAMLCYVMLCHATLQVDILSLADGSEVPWDFAGNLAGVVDVSVSGPWFATVGDSPGSTAVWGVGQGRRQLLLLLDSNTYY